MSLALIVAVLSVVFASPGGGLAVQQPPTPVHPQDWRYVTSPDQTGALLHGQPWGAALTAWPDGAAMGVLEGPVLDQGAAWLRVQDPVLGEGWIAADRLVVPAIPIESQDYRNPLVGDYGGVKPLALRSPDCPAGFPIKGEVGGRRADGLLALGPEDPNYAAHIPFVCFRTKQEAQAWGYFYRNPE